MLGTLLLMFRNIWEHNMVNKLHKLKMKQKKRSIFGQRSCDQATARNKRNYRGRRNKDKTVFNVPVSWPTHSFLKLTYICEQINYKRWRVCFYAVLFSLSKSISAPWRARFLSLGSDVVPAVPWSRSWEQNMAERQWEAGPTPASFRGIQPQDEHETASRR